MLPCLLRRLLRCPTPCPSQAGPCRIVYEDGRSAALRDNAYGDPHTRLVPVILPPSYDREPSRRYPVVYMLSAFASTGWQQLTRSPLAESFDERLARLYAGVPASRRLPSASMCCPTASRRSVAAST